MVQNGILKINLTNFDSGEITPAIGDIFPIADLIIVYPGENIFFSNRHTL